MKTPLNAGEVATRPFIIGELARGNLKNRAGIWSFLQDLPGSDIRLDFAVRAMSMALAVAVAAGCASREEVTVSTPQDCMAAIGALDMDPNHYRSDQAYYDTVIRAIDSWLKQMSEPGQLRALFYQCQAKIEATPEAPQDRLQWLDPYRECQMLIMFRLSRMRSEAAARTMIDLYLDKRLRWDAGAGEMGTEAIMSCPEFSLPILKERRKDGVKVEWLIKLVESRAKGTL